MNSKKNNIEYQVLDIDTIPEVFTDIFERSLSEFTEKYNINDMNTESQNRWNAFLQYTNMRFIKNRINLKMNDKFHNYNLEVLHPIIDKYIYYCNLYQKEVSLNGISKLTGIDYSTLMLWGDPSDPRFEVYKRIMNENEQSNSDLLSSGRNPVGIAMRLNHVHGWNAPNMIKNDNPVQKLQLNDTKKAFESFQIEQKDSES